VLEGLGEVVVVVAFGGRFGGGSDKELLLLLFEVVGRFEMVKSGLVFMDDLFELGSRAWKGSELFVVEDGGGLVGVVLLGLLMKENWDIVDRFFEFGLLNFWVFQLL
jgi:hypothetical protein